MGNWNTAGSGAGAGGFWTGIINLNYPVTIYVAGPRSASSTSSPSDGKTGLTSYISINNITCVTVNGGGAGKYNGIPEVGAGVGGSVIINNGYESILFWTLESFKGCRGGWRATLTIQAVTDKHSLFTQQQMMMIRTA